MKCECGLLSGELLISILETVMYTILEDFECVLYKEYVKNFSLALPSFPLPLFSLVVSWGSSWTRTLYRVMIRQDHMYKGCTKGLKHER